MNEEELREALPKTIALVDALARSCMELEAALRALIPEGWDDGTMDYMPGIKQARDALEKLAEFKEKQHTKVWY